MNTNNPKAILRQKEAEFCKVEEDAFYTNPTDKSRFRAQRKRSEFVWHNIKLQQEFAPR